MMTVRASDMRAKVAGMSNATRTAHTAASSSSTSAHAPRRSRIGTLIAAALGATCACAVAGCDDPTDPEALADLARDEAAEDSGGVDPAAMSLDLDLAAVQDADPAYSMGFAVDNSGCPAAATCTPPSPDWCSTYGMLADAAKIPKLYRDIMVGKCAKNYNSSCYECWDLANYCAQVGTNCTGLQAKCNCIAKKLGA